MSRKIGIIGMGNVGAAVAHGAIAKGLADSYVFIDINEKRPRQMPRILRMPWQIYLAMQTLLQ